jgi:hypothetical protein
LVGCVGGIKHAAFGIEEFAAELTFLFNLIFQVIYLSLFPWGLVQSEVVIYLACNHLMTQAKTSHLIQEVLDFNMRKLLH